MGLNYTHFVEIVSRCSTPSQNHRTSGSEEDFESLFYHKVFALRPYWSCVRHLHKLLSPHSIDASNKIKLLLAECETIFVNS